MWPDFAFRGQVEELTEVKLGITRMVYNGRLGLDTLA